MGFIIELKNPFKKSIAAQSDGLRGIFGNLLAKISKINMEAIQELARKRGQITQLQIEADGLEKNLEGNKAIAATISSILGDSNKASTISATENVVDGHS